MREAGFSAAGSAVLAALLALLGDLVLGRRSVALSRWNESFLVGAGTGTAIFILMSICLGGGALIAFAALLAAAGLARLALGRRLPPAEAAPSSEPGGGLRRLTAASLIALAVAGFAWRAFAGTLQWDGLEVWAAKALVLYRDGHLTAAFPPPGFRFRRFVNYPPLLPLLEALLAMARGRFRVDALPGLFVLFYGSVLVGTYESARRIAGPAAARWLTAAVAWLPGIGSGTNPGGYADLPMAAFAVGAVAAFLDDPGGAPGGARAAPWIAGALVLVKEEGALLLLAALPVALLARAWRRIAPPVVLLVLVRFAGLWAVHVSDPHYSAGGPHPLALAASRLPTVGLACLRELSDPRQWGILWPAWAAAAAFAAFRGGAAARRLALWCALALLADATPFLFTQWPPAEQIAIAFPRLLTQIAPVAALACLAASGGPAPDGAATAA